MSLQFKIEYTKNDSQPSALGAYIHIRKEPPLFQDLISKEEFFAQPEAARHPFLLDLFLVPGVVDVALRSYCVYIGKGELFEWTNVLTGVISLLLSEVDESEVLEMPGSRITVNPTQRRALED